MKNKIKVFFKKITALVLIISLVFNVFNFNCISYATTGEDVQEGQYIKFGTYLGQPIVWRVIHKQDKNSDGIQDLLLFSDKIITLKAFDGNGDNLVDGMGDATRGSYGSNYWEKSNIKAWLNSTAAAGAVDWLGCLSPTSARVNSGWNAYDSEAGFLNTNNFTTTEVNKIIPVTHKTILGPTDTSVANGGSALHAYGDTDPSAAVQNHPDAGGNAYYKNVQDSVFLLGIKELDEYVYSNTNLSDRTTYYKAYVTSEAITQSNSTSEPTPLTQYWYYWTRDARVSASAYVRRVNANGTVDAVGGAYTSDLGVRPALYLNAANLNLSGTGADVVNAYTIVPDTTSPDVTITSDPESPTTASSVTYTFQFTETVTGFDSGDVTVTNGTKGLFNPVDGDTYTLVVDKVADGNQVVTVGAGTCQDAAANPNTQGTLTVVMATITTDPGYALGTVASDRKWFKYYIGKDSHDVTRIMLVAPKDGDGVKQNTFDKSEILDPATYRFISGSVYYIDREGKIQLYN